jgi:hypothetical protein
LIKERKLKAMEKERKIVRMMAEGDTVARLALTQDQINLLTWLKNNDWLADESYYEIEDIGMEITTI